jgi:putative transposase
LSHRDLEALLAERGVRVSDEALRLGRRRRGPPFAAGLRRRRAGAGGKWHRDAGRLKVSGTKRRLWRAVDPAGLVLALRVQARRAQPAAERSLRRGPDGARQAPRGVAADPLASYPPALKRVLPGGAPRRHKGLNNRAADAPRPGRKRARGLQRLKSPDRAQRFLEPVSAGHKHVRPRRHRLPADRYRRLRTERFQQRRGAARPQPAA